MAECTWALSGGREHSGRGGRYITTDTLSSTGECFYSACFSRNEVGQGGGPDVGRLICRREATAEFMGYSQPLWREDAKHDIVPRPTQGVFDVVWGRYDVRAGTYS